MLATVALIAHRTVTVLNKWRIAGTKTGEYRLTMHIPCIGKAKHEGFDLLHLSSHRCHICLA